MDDEVEIEAGFVPEGASYLETPAFDPSTIIHERLKAHGRQVEQDDLLVRIATELSIQLADRQISAAVNQYNRELGRIAEEFEQKRLALVSGYNLILGMVTPLVSRLELAPDERITSVAVASSTGDIRVVNVDE